MKTGRPKTGDTYNIIVIDDERTMPRTFTETMEITHHRTSDEGIAALEAWEAKAADDEITLDELWLDHDLGEDDSKPYGWDDIMPVVKWLEERSRSGRKFKVTFVAVHTANVAAAPVMMDALRRAGYYVVRTKFPVSREP